MRWFEVLAAALFTLDVTGSGFAVAVVSAARTMPMFLLGAFSGVVTEALSRKQVAGRRSGDDLPRLRDRRPAGPDGRRAALAHRGHRDRRRHRLVDRERHAPAHGGRVRRARAGVTGAGAGYDVEFGDPPDRAAGGRASLYQRYGLGGCFTASACVYAVSAWLGSSLSYRQEKRRLVLGNVPRDLMEGLRYVRRDVVIGGVLAVTVAMNLMGFPYSALMAPIGRQIFSVSPDAGWRPRRRRGVRRRARRCAG